MKRCVSVWLPDWPIDRLCRHEPAVASKTGPLALVESGRRGLTITAVNASAAREGVRPGRTLADARAALPGLRSRPAEPARDAEALAALATWCGRYGMQRNVDGVDGIWIDVTGVPHLFGGEAGLMRDLLDRLSRFGLTARAAIADTPGAAYALARFGVPPGRQWVMSEPGETRAALARLPVEALHLDRQTVLTLKRLGLRGIGDLYTLPRVSLERRFKSGARTAAARMRGPPVPKAEAATVTATVLARLDAVLGVVPDPRPPLVAPPVLLVRRLWAEPLLSSEALEAEIAALCAELCHRLVGLSQGARRIRLSLYRSDGTRAEVVAGTSAPCRDSHHWMRLVGGRLAAIDAGFGIDTATLEAAVAETMEGAQETLAGTAASATGCDAGLARLVDRLAGHLGHARVFRLETCDSHVPERESRRVPALEGHSPKPHAGSRRAQVAAPSFLLDPPEPVTVSAASEAIPAVGGPPAVFGWRRVTHRVVRSEGPRRIAPEWWRLIGRPPAGDTRRLADLLASAPRDYYRVEVTGGGQYWMFHAHPCPDSRANAGSGSAVWFLHGIFA
ncbi:MAG: DNA polymerase Y family protein [Hyphomicrobiaceae bacterium]|nr:DNA polymerase Y family protein [Hyphomicrobiaceae bacterium]